jgi:hypothetical protein
MEKEDFINICEILSDNSRFDLLAIFITFMEEFYDDDYEPSDSSPEPSEEYSDSSSFEEENYEIITDKEGFISIK